MNNEYQKLQRLEDYVLGKIAEEVEKKGVFLSSEESEEFMQEIENKIEKQKE